LNDQRGADVKINPKHNKTLLPAIAALTGGLAAAPAGAIELGEIQVQSTLGQPLRASIAYALGPNETLYDFCISLSQSQASNGLPAVRNARVSVANGVISLAGNRAVREPLVSTRVIVDCPYSAHISREYMMFIDPPGSVAQPVAQPRPVATRPVARVETAPIENSTRYRVQPGDTLSGIAERIENRPVGLWDAVNQVFAANPDAFIDGDLNKLKAGSWLHIPDFGAGAPTVADTVAAPVTDLPVVPVEESAGTYEPTVADAEPALDEAVTATQEPAAAPLVPDIGEAAKDTGELKPGDIIIDTQLEAPEVTAESPNVPTASISRPAPVEETGSSYAWLIWLAGAGLALIAGLLMFGRRGRETYDVPPAQTAAGQPMRRKTDLEPTDTTEMPIVVAEDDVYDLDDDSPTAENLALDADLVIGTGLSDGVDVDVAEDFAFASTSSLDLELPDEMSSNTGTYNTDIIPPMMIEDTSIVVDEVFPEEEDDEFDMSVVVDATKVPHPEETTEKDLKAVVVGDIPDETLISDSYTLSQEVDYKVLEQDYEDEMTATQKLNAEISKAAQELADRMDLDDKTEEMPLATVTELDVTAQLPAKNDDNISDLDDTGINEEITVNIEAEEKTVEIVAGDSDKTVEMEVESGKVDTKAS
jgi:murein DD-endopeptidase MepM/ murein hydrolase activator NlpD